MEYVVQMLPIYFNSIVIQPRKTIQLTFENELVI